MGKLVNEEYLEAIIDDLLPEEKGELATKLVRNPKLLISAFRPGDVPCSVICMAVNRGSFNFIDFILKKNGLFTEGADPWYCGNIQFSVPAALRSAGISFYLALVTLQFYSKENRLAELVQTDALSKITRVVKTHYDCLYWNDQGISRQAVLEEDQEDPGSVKNYQEKTAQWFMKIAYDTFQAETQLAKATTLLDQQETHAALGNSYLRIAYMEDYCQNSFFYFLDKALEHYRQAPIQDQRQYVEKIETYVAHRQQLFDLHKKKWRVAFEIDDTGAYRSRTLKEWEESYASAYRREYMIDEDNTVSRHSLHNDIDTGICSTTIDRLVNGELQSEITVEQICRSSKPKTDIRFWGETPESSMTKNPIYNPSHKFKTT